MPFPARFFSYGLLTYMLAAIVWWAVQLWRENDHTFQLESDNLELRYRSKGVNLTQLQETIEYRQLVDRRSARQRMIWAEGLFFAGCLVAGMWLLGRSADREVSLARQRRNFMLSITHELKSPIAAVRLVLETLCKRDLARPQVEQICAGGLRDAARLQTLVEDLLLAARLENNWRPLPEPVDLSAVAHDVVRGLLVRFPKANIRLDFPANLAPVQADKSGFTSVIANLLENAVKYSPEGAPVVFSAERISSLLRLHVADAGSGIPDTEKKAVFEKFYRLGNEETRKATGTGLGLYIVKHVVQAHGGRIRIADNQPHGTVFTIDLPSN